MDGSWVVGVGRLGSFWFVPNKMDFTAQCLNIRRDHRLLACVSIEVTVGAAVGAEGDVEVEG